MKEIFELLLQASANPLSADKMAACVNNENTTIFMGIDAADPDDFILFHNLEVISALPQQKKSIICSSHGFGKAATVVTLNCELILGLNDIAGTSMTNICKFTGLDKIPTGMVSTNLSLSLKCMGLVTLPLSSHLS
jgi:hypothetical protein